MIAPSRPDEDFNWIFVAALIVIVIFMIGGKCSCSCSSDSKQEKIQGEL